LKDFSKPRESSEQRAEERSLLWKKDTQRTIAGDVLSFVLVAFLNEVPQSEAPWFPISAFLGASGSVSPTAPATAGVDAQVVAHFGVARPRGILASRLQGLVFGLGGRGYFAWSPYPGCDWCLGRLSLGPTARLGYAVLDREPVGPLVPDFAVWLQASPLWIIESLPDAPLVPGGRTSTFGTRLEIGLSFVGWTIEVLKLVGVVATEGTNEVGVLTLPVFALGFINSVGVWWEWNGTAVSAAAHRVGASIGASF
jgi:hypothetical protein